MKAQLQQLFRPVRYALALPLFGLLFMTGRCTPPINYSYNYGDNKVAYVGTYTRTEGHVDGQARGIHRISVNQNTGAVIHNRLVAKVTNPSYLVTNKEGHRVYAVSELAHADEPTGFLHVYDVRKKLHEIAKLPTNGQAPCHVELDKTEQFAIVSNYVGGTATLYRMDGENTREVEVFRVPPVALQGRDSWLHSANIAPNNKTVAICDKGLDKIWLFTLDQEQERLLPHPQVAFELEPGAGPRHAVWSPSGRFLYVINELNNSVDVIAHAPEKQRFTKVQNVSTLPGDFTGESFCADIELSPDGRFLYGSNRGHNSIVSYRVNQASGLLEAAAWTPSGGDYPRNFTLTPNGNYLLVANQNSDNIVTMARDAASGRLTPSGDHFELPTPVCLEFLK